MLTAPGLFVSCAGSPRTKAPEGEFVPVQAAPPAEALPPKTGSPPSASPPPALRDRPNRPSRPSPGTAPASPPERPSPPPVPEYILGRGRTGSAALAAFLLETNPLAGDFAGYLAGLYVEEAAAEGVNHDVAFAQMCLETGFLRFGGLVTVDMNNFCGLGSIGPGQPGERFPSPRIGVRAHIQHLKVYATGEPLNRELVDPRYRYVRPGSSPSIKGLAGTWAADKLYADKITSLLERLYVFTPRPRGDR